MLQSLPIALAQVKVRNGSQKLLNKIKTILYSLFRSHNITKSYTIIYLSQYKRNFTKGRKPIMNTGKSKTSEPYNFAFNVT